MTTEKNIDNIPRFRELFRDFEADPPPQSWDVIRSRLAGRTRDKKTPWLLNTMVEWFQPMNRLYPALTVLGVVLIALVIWLGIGPSNNIKGQALIDNTELARGTAFLFRVRDRAIPYDSVRFFGKLDLDSIGRFEFGRVPSGLYLLRIQVHPKSQFSKHYNHGYYGDQIHPDSATLVRTGNPVESYVVRVPKMVSE